MGWNSPGREERSCPRGPRRRVVVGRQQLDGQQLDDAAAVGRQQLDDAAASTDVELLQAAGAEGGSSLTLRALIKLL